MKSTRQGCNDGELLYPKHSYIGCKAKRQRVQWNGGANAPDWLRAWVQRNFRRTQPLPSREENISSLDAAVQHNFRRTLLVASREENISSLGAAVQHNFRRTLLVPSREENISNPWNISSPRTKGISMGRFTSAGVLPHLTLHTYPLS